MPRADLEDAQSAALRKMAGGFLHRLGDCRQPMAGEKPVRHKIDPANPPRPRRTGSAQHPFLRAESARVPRSWRRRAALRQRWPGCFARNVRNASLGRIRRDCRTPGRAIARADCFEQAAPGEAIQQSLENRPHGIRHAKGIGGDDPVRRRQASFAQPAGQLRGSEIIACRHGRPPALPGLARR